MITKKAKYVEDYRQKEDVSLWAEHIRKNPAKYQITKLFLNSLWGKFGQRSNFLNTTIVKEPDELHVYLFLLAYDVCSSNFFDEGLILHMAANHINELHVLSHAASILKIWLQWFCWYLLVTMWPTYRATRFVS